MSVQAASLSQARSWLLAARERSRRCLDSCKRTEARGRVSEQPHSEARGPLVPALALVPAPTDP